MAFRESLLKWMAAIGTASLCTAAQAYSPESPDVVAAVDRAVKYLESAVVNRSDDDKTGEEALIALALLKADQGLNHPRIAKTLELCREHVAGLAPDGTLTMYTTTMVAILFIEADAQLYRKEINKLLSVIVRRQMSDGAWAYKGSTLGDTSQSQYCVLALWEAYHHEMDIPLAGVAGICHWLIRTQDPSGGFSYKGKDSGNLNKKISQEATHSMTAAGMGSLYICMDLLGFNQQQQPGDDAESALPPDVRLVSEEETEEPKKKRPSAMGLVNVNALGQSLQLGNDWFQREYRIKYGGPWQNYYLYGVERFQTFRDKVENRTILEPSWYNDGVEYLLTNQNADGSWRSGEESNPVATSFAIFFLTRSTQKTIGAIDLREGLLKGGRGFQKGELRSHGGKIMAVPLSRSVGDLLATLEEGDDDELTAMAQSVARLNLEGDAQTRTRQQALLRGLVSHRSYQARLVAVKTLASQRSLDNVPPLIYALGDPDSRVVREARNGLRFISRKINGFGLPEQPKQSEVSAAIEQWKAWYLSVRPDGQFFD